ncbi:hypothetical protein ACSS6W_001933 [Trichoderma asperelloides]
MANATTTTAGYIAAVLVLGASTAANTASSASTGQGGFSASNTCSMRNPGMGRTTTIRRKISW